MKEVFCSCLALLLLCAFVVFAEGDKEQGKAAGTGSVGAAPAAADGLVTDKIPKSWYEPFKTASQINSRASSRPRCWTSRSQGQAAAASSKRLPKDPPGGRAATRRSASTAAWPRARR